MFSLKNPEPKKTESAQLARVVEMSVPSDPVRSSIASLAVTDETNDRFQCRTHPTYKYE